MKKLSKLTAVVLSLCLLLSLMAGCGGDDKAQDLSTPDKPKTEATPSPVKEPETPETPETIELEGTVWDIDGILYIFRADGIMEATDGDITEAGGYEWRGSEGVMFMQGVTTSLFLSPDGALFMEGEDENGYLMTYVCPVSELAASDPFPSADDPLTQAAAIQGIDPGLVISYPDTLKVTASENNRLQLDAVSEDYPANNLSFIVTAIGNSFDHLFTGSTQSSKEGMKTIAEKWIKQVHGTQLVQVTASEFYDGGTYYSYKLDVWFDGTLYYDRDASELIKGVIEFRYAGPIGQLFVVEATGDGDSVDTLEVICDKIVAEAKFGGGQWTTGGSASYTSDGRGDVIIDDGWGDIIYDDGWGDIIEDDGWGDIIYDDEWDYYDPSYDDDYYYDYDTGSDYYWDEDAGEWMEGNDYGW